MPGDAPLERRLLAALNRLHRAEPLASGFRIDAVLARLRAEAAADRRPAGHRRAAALPRDPEILVVVDDLAARGLVERDGRRLRLPGRGPALDPQMDERVTLLFDALRSAGAAPPRVDPLARRLGVPAATLGQLRSSGRLVAVAPGIDYPADVIAALRRVVDDLGRCSVARLASEIGTSRRYAAALLADRDRRAVG